MLFRVDLDIPFVYSENDFDEMEKSNYEQFFIIDNKFIKIKNEKKCHRNGINLYEVILKASVITI